MATLIQRQLTSGPVEKKTDGPKDYLGRPIDPSKPVAAVANKEMLLQLATTHTERVREMFAHHKANPAFCATNQQESKPMPPVFHPKQSWQPSTLVGVATSIRWHWNEALAEPEGYDLFIGKKWFRFKELPFLPPTLTDKNDSRDVNWTVTYKVTRGQYELISMKENKPMSDQPAEQTKETSLNETFGHWADDPDKLKEFKKSLRKKLVHAGVHKALKNTGIPEHIMLISIGIAPTGKYTDCQYDSPGTALDAAEVWAKNPVDPTKADPAANGKTEPKSEEQPHDHDFENGICKTCKQHWIKIDKERGAFWGWIADNVWAKCNSPEAPTTKDEREQFVHETLGVQHIKETTLSRTEAQDEVYAMAVGLEWIPDTTSPEELAKQAWVIISPEFKEIRPDVTDKQQFMQMVLGVISAFAERQNNYKTMVEAIADGGLDYVLSNWHDGKHTLKPAAPKNGNRPPAQQNKPAPATDAQSELAPHAGQDVLQSVPGNGNATADEPENVPISSVPDPDDEPVSPKNTITLPVPAATGIKTLTGIPVEELRNFLNRRHPKGAYKQIDGKKPGEKWTDLSPIAARRRFEKVFGPQGLGWRIVPIPGLGKVSHDVEIEHIKERVKNGKVEREAYDRPMHVVTLEGFTFEYALVKPDDSLFYVQTSAISDTDKNDDRGYAYRGAMSSLMKQALRLFGGFDHFMMKWEETAA